MKILNTSHKPIQRSFINSISHLYNAVLPLIECTMATTQTTFQAFTFAFTFEAQATPEDKQDPTAH